METPEEQANNEEPEMPRKCSNCRLSCDMIILLLTLFATCVGVGVGAALRPLNLADDIVFWFELPGELFIRSLKMVIIPLVVTNIIAAMTTSFNVPKGQILGATFGYAVGGNLMGNIIGVACALIIKPGVGVTLPSKATAINSKSLHMEDLMSDLLRNLIPDNIIRACISMTTTTYVYNVENTTEDGSSTSQPFARKLIQTTDSNIIGLLFFSILCGWICSLRKEEVKPLLKVVSSISVLCIDIIQLFMRFLPVGILSMILSAMLSTTNIFDALSSIGLFLACLAAANLFQIIVLETMINLLLGKRNPFLMIKTFIKALVLSSVTGSAFVSLPAFFEGCDKARLSPKLCRVVLPISAMLMKAGSAAFLGVGIIFIAQIEHVELDATKLVTMIFLGCVNTMAMPPTASGGLVVLVLMSTAMNLPARSLALIAGVEVLADRIRTLENAYTIMSYCGVVHRFFGRSDVGQLDTSGWQNNIYISRL